MKYQDCPHGMDIAQAARTDTWKPDQTLHCQQCPFCQEIAQVTGSMQGLLIHPAEVSALPDADLIWLRARLMEMQSAEARTLRPFLIADISASVVSMTAFAVWFTWNWPKIQQLLLRLLT